MTGAGGRAEGCFLGFDFGTRRIGIAVGTRLLRDARSLTTLSSKGQPDWAAIGKLIAEWRPEALVVGRPLTMEGGAQAATRAADEFIAQLQARYGLPVHAAEERMSSVEAQSQLRERRASGERRRRLRDEDVDAAAAKLILEHWLDEIA